MSFDQPPVGFISDAHGHGSGLAKGVDFLRRLGARDIYFLGDAVGYIPSAAALRLLIDNSIVCVQGNHDLALLRGEMAQRESAYRLGDTAALLSTDERRAIAGWPQTLIADIAGTDVLLVHGSPRDPLHEYVRPDTPLEPLLPHIRARVVVMGHSHRPFVRRHAGITFVNCGSCGMPRDDARFGVAVLFDRASSTPWRILRYSIEEETRELLREVDVAPEVSELFATRREAPLVGDFLD